MSSSKLSPFFSYYGGKWRFARSLYPAPQHEVVVEPFAGSAGYSLRYPERKVILCEVDPDLVMIWKYLIQVRPEEILGLPDVPLDGSIDDLRGVPQPARVLMGFWMNRGTATTRPRPSKWMREKKRPGSFWGTRVKRTIASQVEAIRHWKVYHCSYEECPYKGNATWFVDPPYQHAGRHYRHGSSQIDYSALSRWCRSRRGQVIVCENQGADWLPFSVAGDVKTTRKGRRSAEVVWVSNSEPDLEEGGKAAG